LQLKGKEMTERIYAVYHGTEARLVRAANRSQALSHVAKTAFNIGVATQDELVTLLGKGTKVETARPENQMEIDLK
jgi:hypothetical protein